MTMLFLCGRGPAIEEILRQMAAPGCHKIAVFTHAGANIIQVAQELGVWCSTDSINNTLAWPWHPAVIASIGYLTIFKPETLAAVHGRVFNGHAALLPNHRGRSAVPWAIVDGDQYGGITYHWVDSGIDTGRILVQATCQLTSDETQTSLFEVIHYLLAQYFPAALQLAMVDWPGVPQFGKEQYHRAGPPNGGIIDPLWGDAKIERFIRAMTYAKMPYATYCGREVRTIQEYRKMRAEDLTRRVYA